MQCPRLSASQVRSMTKHIISSHQRWDVLLKPGELFWGSLMESPKKSMTGSGMCQSQHRIQATSRRGRRSWQAEGVLYNQWSGKTIRLCRLCCEITSFLKTSHTHTHCIMTVKTKTFTLQNKNANTEYHLIYYSPIIAERKVRVAQLSYWTWRAETSAQILDLFLQRKMSDDSRVQPAHAADDSLILLSWARQVSVYERQNSFVWVWDYVCMEY